MKSAIIILALASVAFAHIGHPRPILKRVHPAFAQWRTGQNTKVVGGEEATPHSIPYQVALFLDGYFCGASLISKRWVLTAAHCGELTDQPQVVLGAHNIRETESTQVILNGAKPVIHPDWNSATLENDIALIKLPQDAPINENIQIVQLAAANAPDYAGSDATVSGWGRDSDSATSISPVLRVVTTGVLTNEECQDEYGPGIPVVDTVVCIDGSEGKSSCNGDSGGPLTVDGVQIGLTSYGVSLGCEVGFPAAFTRISSYRSFIDSTIA